MDELPEMILDYQQQEVIAAQRSRLLHSRMGLVALLGFFGTIYVGWKPFSTWVETKAIPPDWTTPAIVFLIFFWVTVYGYFIFPWMDYRGNRIWRKRLYVWVDDQGLWLSGENRQQAVIMQWRNLSKVVENSQCYLLFFGSEKNVFILPRRVLGGQEMRLQQILARRNL
jgi:hypothetical protein